LGSLVISQDEFYKAFGEFILWYARVENTVHALFRHCTGMPEDVARVISGGMRISDVMGITKRLAKVREFDENTQAEIENVFTQMNEISKLRDVLIHRGGEYVAGHITSTNLATVRFKEDWEVVRLKIDDISDAKADCVRLYVRLDSLIDPAFYWTNPDAMKWLLQPWRYKHRPPDTPNRASPPKRPKRERPPPSSHE